MKVLVSRVALSHVLSNPFNVGLKVKTWIPKSASAFSLLYVAFEIQPNTDM